MSIRTNELMVVNGRLKQAGFSFKTSHGYSRSAVFICECGQRLVTTVSNVQSGRSQSCGCLMMQRIREANTTHGRRQSNLYGIWTGMKSRCENKNNPAWDRYGGRGITVCERWKSFECFLVDMGEPEGDMSLDRIDNDRGYSLDNCRWATVTEQSRNRRSNVKMTVGEKTMCIAEWSEETGINSATLRRRIKNGWSPEEVVNTPLFGKGKGRFQ